VTSTGRPADAALRVVRAVVLAATTLGCAVAAHGVAGGSVPGAAGLMLLGALTLAVTTVLGRWRLNPWTLAPTLAGLQVVLHTGFGWTAGTATAPPAAVQGVHAAHHGHQAIAGTAPLSTSAALAPAMEHHVHQHPAMIAAHVLAVVVTTALAVGTERAMARTARQVVVVLRHLLQSIPPVGSRPRPVVPVVRVRLLVTRALLSARPHRGPPLVARTA